MKDALRHSLGPLVGITLFAAALWVLHGALRDYHYQDVVRQMRDVPPRSLVRALGLTALSYLVLTGYDTLALRYVRRPLSYGRTAVASFIGYAFSHNLGLSLLTGGSVRYRLYSAWGLTAAEVTNVVAFCGVTFWLGFLALGGAVFALEPPAIPEALHLPVASARPLGLVFLLLVAGYVSWTVLRKRPLTIRGWEFPVLSARLLLSQIAVSSLDWMLAGSVVYALLPRAAAPSYPAFLAIYLLAMIAGVASQVPAGLGVFETIMLLLLPPAAPASAILGSLLAFRVVYNFLPLTVAAALLGSYELLRAKSVFALARLRSPAPPEPARPGPADLERARAVVARSRSTAANLALLGDKSLLFSESGRAFIMYGVEGRSWVALGDPVGPEEEAAELVWQFRELCDRHGGWPAFYQVRPKTLPLYLDLGLTPLELGEEARVPLAGFSLEGRTWKGFRNLCHGIEKEGWTFAVIPRKTVASLLAELKAVSDAWLAEKRTRETGFSLGFFDPAYLTRFPAAVVRREGRVAAFANIWLSTEKEELSPDLMRYRPDAPDGVMDYLFIQLMLWGQENGYRSLNLGMAPLSGLENRALAPLWNRLGALAFRHGEHFYNVQGLRQYKEKFAPEWEPRYLAAPDGLALPRVLANLASLIAGGLTGIVAK